MTATNHVLTGIAAGFAMTAAAVPWWVVLPVAFCLHFVLDALPHYGYKTDKSKWALALARLKWFLPLDAAVAATALMALAILRPEHWPVAAAAGVACASPDLFSIPRFLRFLRKGQTQVSNTWFHHFHHNIQWGERGWGIWLEAVWALGMAFIVFAPLVKLG